MSNRKELLDQLEVQANERFTKLESTEEIKTFLKENGAYQREADRIYHKINREVQKEYVEQVESLILDGQTLETIRDQIAGKLQPEMLQSVMTSGLQVAKRRVQAEVHQMVDEGQSWEEMLERFQLPTVSEEEIAEWADARHAKNLEDAEISRDGNQTVIIGGILLAAGVGLTLSGYISTSNGGSYTVWYGLIVVGIMTIVKGIAKKSYA